MILDSGLLFCATLYV